MALDKDRLAKVEDDEMELIFRIARIALEIDNGSGGYEDALGKTSQDIDAVFIVLDEVIHDR